MNKEGALVGSYMTHVINCPKHGEHYHTITSNIQGHEGSWCQICWLESLGPALPSVYKRIPFNREAAHGIKGEA
jgi:hypothetical protein